jgi:hypothetical protein
MTAESALDFAQGFVIRSTGLRMKNSQTEKGSLGSRAKGLRRTCKWGGIALVVIVLGLVSDSTGFSAWFFHLRSWAIPLGTCLVGVYFYLLVRSLSLFVGGLRELVTGSNVPWADINPTAVEVVYHDGGAEGVSAVRTHIANGRLMSLQAWLEAIGSRQHLTAKRSPRK